MAFYGFIFAAIHQGELGIPHDGTQDVVEIVGNTANQRSQRLKLLSLMKLLFQLLIFAQVLLAADKMSNLTIAVFDRRDDRDVVALREEPGTGESPERAG